MTEAARVTTVRSSDGAPIGWRTVGAGPDVLIVHGSIATGEQWAGVGAALAARGFACHLMDRRGRGLSGNADAYSIAQEADDIAAVIEALPPGATLVAHSYGGLCALEALRRELPVVLYEPPLPVLGDVAGEALAPYTAAVERGDLDEALTIGLTRIVGLPADLVAGLRHAPVWPGMAALTPTWVRELKEIDALPNDADRYARVAPPVTCLVGARSPAFLIAATEALAARIPGLVIETIPRQDHMAHMLTPETVAGLIVQARSRGH
jgi:pimeloyl-ACP methyl ester carboxylesterase